MAANGILVASLISVNDPQSEQFLSRFQELDKAAPRIVVARRFSTNVYFYVIRPLFNAALKLVTGKQFDPTPVEFQRYRAKFARLICEMIALDEIPEVLTSPEKCDGPCENHVHMLVRGERSLCFNCWTEDLEQF